MDRLITYWHFTPGLIIFLAALSAIYCYMLHFRLVVQSVYFFIGLAVIIIATASPLHFLGMHYLFSAHMTAHVLILMVAAPLMILCIPAENRFKKQLVSFSKYIRQAVLLCWITGIGVMWFWHIPFVYHHYLSMNSMSGSTAIHQLHLLSLWLAGIIFWWIIASPYKKYQLPPLTGILYLSIACVFCSLLGLLITFAPANLFTSPMSMMDTNGFNNMIRNDWGISTKMDQQIAGLIMWVPCCFIYLSAAMFLLKKWYHQKEEIIHAPSIIQLNHISNE